MQLRVYVAGNKRDWNTFTQPLTYHHDSQPNGSIYLPLFFLTLMRQRLGPVTIDSVTGFPSNLLAATSPNACFYTLFVKTSQYVTNRVQKFSQ